MRRSVPRNWRLHRPARARQPTPWLSAASTQNVGDARAAVKTRMVRPFYSPRPPPMRFRPSSVLLLFIWMLLLHHLKVPAGGTGDRGLRSDGHGGAHGLFAGGHGAGHFDNHKRHRGRSRWGRSGGGASSFSVEGCFSRFDAFAIFTPDISTGIFNNRRCQALCGERGYVLAATNVVNFSNSCLCGDNYPSLLTQVDTGRCDRHCNPERATCFFYTCCGSQDGQLFTVSFSRPQDVLKQLLQRLSFNFQHSSPFFLAKVLSPLSATSPFTLLPPPSSESSPSSTYHLVTSSGCPPTTSLGDSTTSWLPVGGGLCVSLHWATATTYDDAQEACRSLGGHLPIIASAMDEERVSAVLSGCTAWLGLRRRDGSSRGQWEWELPFAAWVSEHQDGDGQGGGGGGGLHYECARMDGSSGQWTVARCDVVPPGKAVFACQRPAHECQEQHDDGKEWVVMDGPWCYSRQHRWSPLGSGNSSAWVGMHEHCRQMGGWVASPADRYENERIRRVVGLKGAFLGVYRVDGGMWRRDLWGPDTEASAAGEGAGEGGGCWFITAADGLWRETSCEEGGGGMVAAAAPPIDGALCELSPIPSSAPSPGGGPACFCPLGWWRYDDCRGCYRYIHLADHHDSSISGSSWPSARSACAALGGDLALVDSEGENRFLTDMIKQLSAAASGGGGGGVGAASTFVGNGRRAKRGVHGWTLYEHWGQEDGGVSGSSRGTCAVLETSGVGGGGGDWRPSTCSAGNAQCIICQARQVSPQGGGGGAVVLASSSSSSSSPDAASEEWAVEEATTGAPSPWSSGWLPVRIRSVSKGRYLTCDTATGLLTLLPASDGGDTSSVFMLDVDDDTDSFRLRYAKPGKEGSGFLVVTLATAGGDGGGDTLLRCEDQSGSTSSGGGGGRAEALIRAERPLAALASRWLRIAVVPRSSDLQERGSRECSMAAYDAAPGAPSFRCTRRSGGGAEGGLLGADQVWLEQQALLVFDWQRYLLPRMPLPESRTRCINDAHVSTFCTFAYGQGFTIGRTFTVDWNYLIFDTISINLAVSPSIAVLARGPPLRTAGAAGGGGMMGVSPVTGQPVGGNENMGGGVGGVAGSPVEAIGQTTATAEAEEAPASSELSSLLAATKGFQNDLTVAYNNILEYSTTKGYVETRNWQFTTRVPPRTTTTLQLWLQVLNLHYRWRAMFAARGSFRLLYNGRPLGSHYSLGDLSNQEDLFFYIFGRYDYPIQVSAILTVGGIEEESWPVPIPSPGVSDEDGGDSTGAGKW